MTIGTKPFNELMKMKPILAAALFVGAFPFVSCTPTQQTYGLGGAAAGAALGAITGGDTKDIVRGAAIGGAAGTGYAVYKERQGGTTQPNVVPPTPQAPPPVQPSNYPEAYPSGTPGVVISPYKPHNKVRVKDFKAGDLAQDPTTGKIFVVPE